MIPFPSKYYQLLSGLPDSVLLETSRLDEENARSYLFVNPARLLKAETLDGIPALFEQIEEALGGGMFVAGYMSFECGYHFEPRAALRPPARSKLPLAWFGVYKRPFVFDHRSGAFDRDLPPEWQELVPPQAYAGDSPRLDSRLDISPEKYFAKVEAIRDYIAAGDTYQVNFTTKALFDYSGSPAALYAALRNQQKVPYAAFLNLGDHHVLSFSPELFFRIKDGRITTRPMKGTAPRGRYAAEDARLGVWLRNDPKNRSEHVMIVDLLRSDIGKIAEIGSVRVDDLFAVEKYETLFQMTSTVSGLLRRGTTLYEVFRAVFPSGSVTGAPKCRTIQVIQELEREPRGIYTGAIGYFSPGSEAVFNVPIRTAVLDAGSGEMGVGSGIVFDSVPDEEYEECLLKVRFLTYHAPSFQLVETLQWDGQHRFLRQHLERLRGSAEYFGFPFNEPQIVRALERNQDRFQAGQAYRVRLLLNIAGHVAIENAPLEAEPAEGSVMLSPIRTSSRDRFLYHKTTCRQLYERAHAEARRQGHADVIFANERGELTEGARNNIFVEIDGMLLTPPVECGLLPGVYRQHVLKSDPRASERVLAPEDLKAAEAVYLCNSVRGLRRVRLAGAGVSDPPRLTADVQGAGRCLHAGGGKTEPSPLVNR